MGVRTGPRWGHDTSQITITDEAILRIGFAGLLIVVSRVDTNACIFRVNLT